MWAFWKSCENVYVFRVNSRLKNEWGCCREKEIRANINVCPAWFSIVLKIDLLWLNLSSPTWACEYRKIWLNVLTRDIKMLLDATAHLHCYVSYSVITMIPCNFHSTTHAKQNTISWTQLCRPHMNTNSCMKWSGSNHKFHPDTEISKLLITI